MSEEYPPILDQAIDVHAHYLTQTYRQACEAAGQSQPDGFPMLPEWSHEAALTVMDQVGVATALLSISSPGVHFGNDEAARILARRVNEEGADIVAIHPGRFGLLASLPLPDVESALAELVYAFEQLHVDGIALLTHYQGHYLGNTLFEPIMAEMNRRHAVAVLHPTSPACWEAVSLGHPRPMLEFPIDTTRAVVNLALTGTIDRYPNIRFVIPHAGGALPVLVDRVHSFATIFSAGQQPIDVLTALRGLYYDLAGTPLPRALPALLTLTEPDHLLYGSDFPFTPGPLVQFLAAMLATTDILDEGQRGAMLRNNALRLFPRLQL
ncbi:MAG: amidohydrolase [Ktedonobacteraceae bacterium]|nr:amidohydrolase [Ktedonobacteraceae bacterium]